MTQSLPPSSLPHTTRRKRVGFSLLVGLGASLVVAGAGLAFSWSNLSGNRFSLLQRRPAFTKQQLSTMLADSAALYQFPTEIPLPDASSGSGSNEAVKKGKIQYSFEPALQSEMEGLMKSYRPDYGAFVAIDAETGKVLSMVSFTAKNAKLAQENLALRASFPSASVFKVVTAAAVIENQKFGADTLIHFNGANHTLYRGNILKDRFNRWSRYATLKDAFAKSINTVFGRIGAYNVGSAELSDYASRFGFNHPILADFPIQIGRAPIPPNEDAWGLAETASGYTRNNTMSPLQAAMIASTVANEGKMMEPYFVQSVSTESAGQIYQAEPKLVGLSIDPSTADEIKRLMRETVAHGTASHTFRGFNRSKFRDIDVGGKTGSLTGTDPKGKYDWFIGFANGRGHRLAFAALTIHETLWRVKSSYLARKAIEKYFSDFQATP